MVAAGPGAAEPGAQAGWLCAQLRALGIRQLGEDILRRPCTDFDLPREREAARALHEELLRYLAHLRGLYPFGKGLGLAAPQIGVARALAVVVPADGEPVTLLNPRVLASSAACDQKYEGCLSFFDVRGLVSRPLVIAVQSRGWDGTDSLIRLDHARARLAAHEIDHLQGRLYTDRLSPGARPVPVTEYRGSGTPWQY